MNDIVIARYREDLDWIAGIPEEFAVHIYNKGDDPVTSPAVKQRAASIVERPNIGRESETYIYHMLESHSKPNDLSEFTVFTQGDPTEHSPDFIELLRNWRQWSPVQALSWQWRSDKNIPPAALLEVDRRAFVGSLKVRPELFSLAIWTALQFFDAGAMQASIEYRALHGLPEGINIASHFLELCGLSELSIDAAKSNVGKFSYGAVFAVHRSRMCRLSPDVLRRMMVLSCGASTYGYIFERMWLHFFGEEFLLSGSLGEA